jgi:hypothetical protein
MAAAPAGKNQKEARSFHPPETKTPIRMTLKRATVVNTTPPMDGVDDFVSIWLWGP